MANNIGLFLDFDGVLTDRAVNLQFADMLGIAPRLTKLEDEYANGSIDNGGFNKIFIPLLRDAGFTEQFASDRFRDIRLRPFAEELIAAGSPDIYIVSSSPSYYLDRFATKFKINPDNVICSRYEFSKDGGLSECIEPCGVIEKARFVESKVGQYAVSVGVGDSPEQDAKFMDQCTFKILMGRTRGNYLHASDLYAIKELVNTTRSIAAAKHKDFLPAPEAAGGIPPECAAGVKTLLKVSNRNRNVFIMTPFRKDTRYSAAIETIKAELEARNLKGWTAADKDLNGDLWTNVRCFMHACDHGIALITAHEEIKGRAVKYKPDVFNPNVMAEVGYMMAQGKKVLLLKDSRMVSLPTDWLGKLYTNFDFHNPSRDIKEAMSRWAEGGN